MIRYRRYNAGTRQRNNRLHPDAELELALAAREAIPSEMSDRALLRGIPATKATQVRVSEPWKRTSAIRRHKVYDGEGNVITRTRTNTRNKRSTTAKRNDVALMANMGTIHDPNE